MPDNAATVRTYALDTNVLLHDPTSLFRFEEHDVFIPMTVLEELDLKKTGMSEVARNARQASRFINGLIENHQGDSIDAGLELSNPEGLNLKRQGRQGRLYFEIDGHHPEARADNRILSAVLAYREAHAERTVVLVTKDINLRIKATIHGLPAEDYENDRVLDDFTLLFTGSREVGADFWEQHPGLKSGTGDDGRTWYELAPHADERWRPNQCLYFPGDDGVQLRVMEADEKHAHLSLLEDHTQPKHAVWGITARNREQNFALNMLLDPEVDFVTLLGNAGTGKTLLSLAAGLAQVMEAKRYREIIMTRATVSVGQEIGFLPGTEEEKMTPWMGALTDNLEVLTSTTDDDKWSREATQDLITSRIKIRSLNFMRGRTFLERYLIIDEAQNLTSKQMKTLITRAGPGTKIVCLGNVEQIDTPYLTETTSGLTYVVDRFKDWPHSAHITLRRGERSRLADFAAKAL